MAIRNIRIEGDPILRKKSKIVKEMNERTSCLIKDMFDTMYEAGGVGLSAPQVGVLKRICVVDCGMENPDPHSFIDPEIVYTEGNEPGEEGCLSVPGYKGQVIRAKKVKVRYLDEKLTPSELEANDLLARCIQHEIDHLDGILYIDKVEGELKKAGEESTAENQDESTGEKKTLKEGTI